MNRLFSCDEMRLADLLDGSLTGDAEHMALDHLDQCEPCRTRLETLAGVPSWWHATQRFLKTDEWDEQPWEVAERQQSSADSTCSDAASDSTHIPSLALIRPLLGPSDDPESLGRLGHYEVRGWIGTGATGIVMKAFDPRLHRFVAIKILTPALLHNAAARLRFEREGRAMAAVVHPHVVPVYSVDEYRGVPYIVMQLVTGGSLQRRLDSHGPLGVCETVRIALQTARGLSAAHDQGLVHRDIKPANILLEPQVERVVVTDFSLARVADDAQLTLSGIIAGTPPYMAPEQARGETLDARSDLFSLGSVIYAMCTGHPPFWSEGVFGTLRQVCESEPTSVCVRNPNTPAWLDQLIAKLHSKDPAHRFASASELASILEQELAHLQNPQTIAPPPRPWLPPREPATGGKRSASLRRLSITSTMLIAAFAAAIAIARLSTDRNPSLADTEQLDKQSKSPSTKTESAELDSLQPSPSDSWYSQRDLVSLESMLSELESSLQTASFRESAKQWHDEVTRLSQDIDQLARSNRLFDRQTSGGSVTVPPPQDAQ